MATTRRTEGRTYRTVDFPKAYERLRTVLDGLQVSALRYCLEEKTAAKRVKRIAEVDEILMPIIIEMQRKLTIAHAGGCPEGYFDCGGVCVPYQCPDK